VGADSETPLSIFYLVTAPLKYRPSLFIRSETEEDLGHKWHAERKMLLNEFLKPLKALQEKAPIDPTK